MSAAAGSAKKSFPEVNEGLYDPYQGSVPSFEYFAEIPWPAWSDAQLNAEVWEEGKSKPATGGPRPSVPANGSAYFEEEEECELPFAINDYVHSWKRPHEVFPEATLAVYVPGNVEFALEVPSPVAECDFFKSFSEQLPILQSYAFGCGFPVELESATFAANTHGDPWRPWHHVYGSCGAGKDQPHRPAYSAYGKYVLRLFYFGSWRRFVVDDRIPCDKNGLCMLPVTQVAGELWPVLLMKGLLKIVALTPCSHPGISLMDFPLVTLFTGWIWGRISTANKTREQIWRRLVALAPRYELPGEDGDARIGSPTLKDNSKKGSSKKEEKKAPERTSDAVAHGSSCFLLATLEGFSWEEHLLESYKVGVAMVRDLPLVTANVRKPTKKWKRIRWIYWASEKGLWTDETQLPPYRRLQSITFVAELNRFLMPDPREEATLFEIAPSPQENAASADEPANGEADGSRPTQWSDFLKFHEYLFGLEVFFKPSSFPFSYRVTSLEVPSPGVPPPTPATAKTSTKAPPPPPQPPQNSYYSYPALLPTGNEPPLLLLDSPGGVFLGFSYWVHPKRDRRVDGYLEPDQPELLRVGQGSLVVERLDWRTVEQGEILAVIKTVGNSCAGIQLKPGRHLLRLWHGSDCPYALDVHSNVEVTVHKGYKVRSLMTSESTEILNYIGSASNAFLNLTQKFGKPDLPAALKAFYRAIMPGNDRIPGYQRKMDGFVETFLDCILLTLKDVVPSTDELKIMLWALRSLFVNPDIRCELPRGGPASSIFGTDSKKGAKKATVPIRERTLSEILFYPWTPEEIRQIVTIQKVFRGFRVRLLWKSQTPARREFKAYAERLKKVCDAVFAPQRRELEVGRLIRKIVTVNPDLRTSFRFWEDLPKVTQAEEFTGRVPGVEPFAWVAVARFIVASHSEEPVACAFHFSSNLERFIVQAVDNDTDEEVFRLTNCVSPHYYRSNVRGYTICIFGWNDSNAKTVNWRLEMVRVKHLPPVHLCNTALDLTCHPYGIPVLETTELKNFYVPNHRNRVCRCLVRVQKRTLLTVRLSVSYPKVTFLARILLDRRFCPAESEFEAPDKVMKQVRSTDGTVMMSAFLEYVEPSHWWEEANADADSTLYVLEAFVLNESWPLTKREWGVVEPIRVNGESWKDSATSLQSKKGSDSRKKPTRASKRSVGEQKPIESPFWHLQVLTDADASGEAMTVEEDRSYAESVKAMKISWEEKNPGRRSRGRDLRLQFLCAIHHERKGQAQEGEADFEEPDKDSDRDDDVCGDLKSLLDRMSSFSYLTADTSPKRLLVTPRVRPPMPTEELLQKYRKQPQREALTVASAGNVVAESSEKSQKNIAEDAEEDRKDFLSMRVHYRTVLANYLAEEQKLSQKLMEEAYERRSKGVERLSR